MGMLQLQVGTSIILMAKNSALWMILKNVRIMDSMSDEDAGARQSLGFCRP
jgi:hypothetical protein